jgi:hypothetical protein
VTSFQTDVENKRAVLDRTQKTKAADGEPPPPPAPLKRKQDWKCVGVHATSRRSLVHCDTTLFRLRSFIALMRSDVIVVQQCVATMATSATILRKNDHCPYSLPTPWQNCDRQTDMDGSVRCSSITLQRQEHVKATVRHVHPKEDSLHVTRQVFCAVICNARVGTCWITWLRHSVVLCQIFAGILSKSF